MTRSRWERRAVLTSIGALGVAGRFGQRRAWAASRPLLTRKIPASGERLPAVGFRIVAVPMKIRGGSGGPLRIVALVP